MKRFLTWLLLEPGDKLIRVKSWRPWIGPHGVEWPAMLVDRRDCRRHTVIPVWDRERLLALFGLASSP